MLECPKKGDEIIVTSLINGGTCQFLNTIVKVTSVVENGSNPYFYVELPGNPQQGKWAVYLTDTWMFATREARIDFWKKRVESIEKELKDAVLELEFQTKYECEEEFLADKIEELLATGKTKKQKVEVLKLLTNRFRK